MIITALDHFRTIHTRGHTSGGICLYEENLGLLFSGDTVFPDEWFGRTDLPTGTCRTLLGSFEKFAMLDVNILRAGRGNPLFQYGNRNMEKALRRAGISLENP